MKALRKINRFYLVMVVVFVALAVLVAISLRIVFGAITLSGEVDEALFSASSPRINRDKVEEALESVTSREIPPLDL